MRSLFTFIFLFLLSYLAGQDFIAEPLSLNSEILNEARKITIFRPINISHNDSVILIYLLDGEYAEYRYKKIVETQPKKSIVGIGIANTNRNRDMLPVKEADKFLEFIEKELIPEIEKDLNVSQRILFGHSFSGCFTVYSMINSPGLFYKYIASSPTPIMKMVEPSIYKNLNTELDNQIKFYFSYGSKDMKQVRKWGEQLNNALKEQHFDKLKWGHDIYEGENHNTSDLKSLINGLKF